jgi:hypothetical protein
MKHVSATVELPSVRSGKPVSRDLEKLLLSCLAKSSLERPGDAAELLCNLESCATEGAWTAHDAAAWWAARDKSARPHEEAASATIDHASVRPDPAPDATMVFDADTASP